jgi:hypothetical protein
MRRITSHGDNYLPATLFAPSCAETRSRRNSRRSAVEVEQYAEPFASLDPAVRVRRGLRALDQYVPEPLVVPLEPIVLHELMNRPSQVRLSQWNDPVQTLALIESTNLSAYAFRFGLLGGNRSTSTPTLFIAARNSRVYSGSRSRIRYRFPSRKPSPASSRFRAT